MPGLWQYCPTTSVQSPFIHRGLPWPPARWVVPLPRPPPADSVWDPPSETGWHRTCWHRGHRWHRWHRCVVTDDQCVTDDKHRWVIDVTVSSSRSHHTRTMIRPLWLSSKERSLTGFWPIIFTPHDCWIALANNHYALTVRGSWASWPNDHWLYYLPIGIA